MSASNLIKRFIFLNLLIFVSYGDDSSNQLCKPAGSSWEENGTLYRSLLYRNDLYAYPLCYAGFKTASSIKVRCVNGVWENSLPPCERIASRQCEPQRTLERVIKKCDDGVSENSVCHYRCPDDYFLKGSRERRCQRNLQWSGIEPQCISNRSYNNFERLSSTATTINNSSPSSHTRNKGKIAENSPCEENNGGCSHICQFHSGSVQCSCRPGYELVNGKNCTDIDECQGSHSCSQKCLNTLGSYICDCYSGYALKNRYQCRDIDECEEGRHYCKHSCVNTPGNYICQCDPGYEIKNKYHCEKIKATPTTADHYARRSRNHDREKINANKPKSCDINNGGCEQECDFSFDIPVCKCKNGYRPLKDGKCQDIDECAQNNGGCSDTCTNAPGSYQCSCPRGFRFKNDWKTCIEIKVNPANAVHYARHNSNQDREKINGNEPKSCDINNGGCEQECDSSFGFPVCVCKNGYRPVQDGKCQDIDECHERQHYCSHKCINAIGSYICECNSGYKIKDVYRCEDIDECAQNNSGCSDACTNVPGSYQCSCPRGFRLKNDEKTCIDIDECRFSYQNKCNQRCINNPGSYTCSCEPGYILKNDYECEGCRKNSYRSEIDNVCIECPLNSVTDSIAKASIADCNCLPGFMGNPSHNIPCDDINECFTNNFGCSHFCINTPGSALCSCPLGFELKKDNKTCVDRDECQVKKGGCETFCHNTLGSFNCSCSNGYALAEDNYSCIDKDECAVNNGNCSDICNNFPGGHYCSCNKGFRLDVEGKTCLGARCLSVAVPHRSTLRCKVVNNTKVILKPHDDFSQNPSDYPLGTICKVKCGRGFNVTTPYEAIECLEDGNWNATTPQCLASHCPSLKIPENGSVYPPVCTEELIPVHQQCFFICNPGYEMFGEKSFVKCKNNVTWTGDPPSCRPVYTVPSIICPNDITIDLRWNESSSNVSIPQPMTNMEVVEVYPDWIRLEQYIPFLSGKTEILFKVRNLDSNVTSQCTMTINIIDKQPPIFTICPESFSVSDVGYKGIAVTWDEPVAFDNVAIQSVVKNLEPNSTLSAGVHFVEYIAKDAAGNSATCAFQINITHGHCIDLNDPENGKANCMDWLMGRLCRPACDPGYLREPSEPKFFACGNSRQWTPTDTISPCLPHCLNGTVWSSLSESCEDELAFITQ